MSDQKNHPTFPTRRLPVRPNLDQLKHQAKDLLRAISHGEPEAIAEFDAFHPRPIGIKVKLADAQIVVGPNEKDPRIHVKIRGSLDLKVRGLGL